MIHSKPNNKRKREDTTLKNTEKHVKKNNLERGAPTGSPADDETYKYFQSLYISLYKKHGENNINQNLVKNVLDEVKGKEVVYSSNLFVSKVITKILSMASPEVLESFSEAFSKDLYTTSCSNENVSEVIIQLVQETANRATEHLQETKIRTYSEEHIEYCGSFALKTCTFLLNNVEDFVNNEHYIAIIRTCILTLTGLDPRRMRFAFMLQPTFRVVPEEWSKIAVEFCRRLSSWPQFTAFPYVESTSKMFQAILLSLTKCNNKLQQKLIHKLVQMYFPTVHKNEDAEETLDSNNFALVFKSIPAVKLFENAILLANEENLEYMNTLCFKNNLLAISLLKQHCVENFISVCKSEELFESIMNELASSFGDILASANIGILVSLAKGCRRFGCQQKLYAKSIRSALNCEDSNNSLELVAKLLALKDTERTFLVSINGSKIIQEMLHFKKPIKIVKSLLSMSASDILKIFRHSIGCNIGYAFFESEFIDENSRKNMCEILKGTFQQLVLNENTSRLLERIWDKMDSDSKSLLLESTSDTEGDIEEEIESTTQVEEDQSSEVTEDSDEDE